MQSNGAVQSAERGRAGSRSTPCCRVRPAASRPAPTMGERASHPDLITVDMGGTSYDVAVIRNLQPGVTTESWIGRYRVALPMLDIHTVGAGRRLDRAHRRGRSAARRAGERRLDSGAGLLWLGAATRPTVTDADVLLGYVDPDSFLGGEMRLDKARAEDRHRARHRRPPSAWIRSRRRLRSSTSSTPTWRTRSTSSPPSAGTTRATSPCSPPAARARSMPAARPRTSASRPWWCRCWGPCSAPWAT